jgi:hypothetical protein
MAYALSDALLDELDPPRATFTVDSCRWSAGIEGHLITLRCVHGREVRGLASCGSHRAERRNLVAYLRRRHEAEHGCCQASGG